RCGHGTCGFGCQSCGLGTASARGILGACRTLERPVDDASVEDLMSRKNVTPHVWVMAFAALALRATAATIRTEEARTPRTAAEFDAMFREINNWRRWGAGDELGTMNLVTAQKVREAAALVRRGITVSLSHNPMPDE